MEILPAIIPQSYDDLRDKLSRVESLVATVQIDVMDGRLTKSSSWPYNIHSDSDFSKIMEEEEGLPFWDRLNFEMDLMVKNPENEVEKWIAAGASRLIIHLEAIPDPTALIEKVKGREVEVGIAIGMETDVEEVLPYLDGIDAVQFMAIRRIGYQGEAFDEEVIRKIEKLRSHSPQMVISVDGGVNLENAPALISAGANRLIAGSAIFASEDVEEAIKEFQNL